jgi:hypothetical protein
MQWEKGMKYMVASKTTNFTIMALMIITDMQYKASNNKMSLILRGLLEINRK